MSTKPIEIVIPPAAEVRRRLNAATAETRLLRRLLKLAVASDAAIAARELAQRREDTRDE